jgi:putative PIN family toxin of toxin-antitoxin system
MRVLLDLTLFARYLLCHDSPFARIIDQTLQDRRVLLFSSLTILEELDRMLRHELLEEYYDRESRIRFVAMFAAMSDLQEMPDRVPRIGGGRGRIDDWTFACAVIGQVDFLVSDNENVLGWKVFGKTRVVTPQQFAGLLQEKVQSV